MPCAIELLVTSLLWFNETRCTPLDESGQKGFLTIQAVFRYGGPPPEIESVTLRRKTLDGSAAVNWRNGEAVAYGDYEAEVKTAFSRKVILVRVNTPAVTVLAEFNLSEVSCLPALTVEVARPPALAAGCNRLMLIPAYAGSTQREVFAFDGPRAQVTVAHLGIHVAVVLKDDGVCATYQTVVREGRTAELR